MGLFTCARERDAGDQAWNEARRTEPIATTVTTTAARSRPIKTAMRSWVSGVGWVMPKVLMKMLASQRRAFMG